MTKTRRTSENTKQSKKNTKTSKHEQNDLSDLKKSPKCNNVKFFVRNSFWSQFLFAKTNCGGTWGPVAAWGSCQGYLARAATIIIVVTKILTITMLSTTLV